MRLDTFLATHTSEDNAAYEVIVARESVKKKHKHAWLYKEDQKAGAPLAITGVCLCSKLVGESSFSLSASLAAPSNINYIACFAQRLGPLVLRISVSGRHTLA